MRVSDLSMAGGSMLYLLLNCMPLLSLSELPKLCISMVVCLGSVNDMFSCTLFSVHDLFDQGLAGFHLLTLTKMLHAYCTHFSSYFAHILDICCVYFAAKLHICNL